jgi:DNA-binding NarL/FixJ family response regulator
MTRAGLPGTTGVRRPHGRDRGWVFVQRDAADKVEALTPPQRRTLRAFCTGKTAHAIAQERGCSVGAVKKQLHGAYERLGLPAGKVARAAYLLGRYEERTGVPIDE